MIRLRLLLHEMDEALRKAEREFRAAPHDTEAADRYAHYLHRAGKPTAGIGAHPAMVRHLDAYHRAIDNDSRFHRDPDMYEVARDQLATAHEGLLGAADRHGVDPVSQIVRHEHGGYSTHAPRRKYNARLSRVGALAHFHGLGRTMQSGHDLWWSTQLNHDHDHNNFIESVRRAHPGVTVRDYTRHGRLTVHVNYKGDMEADQEQS